MACVLLLQGLAGSLTLIFLLLTLLCPWRNIMIYPYIGMGMFCFCM